MRFKFDFKKNNFYLMTLVLTLCLFTCLVWLVLREYFYFIIYLLATLIMINCYYFTSYVIDKNYLIIKLGIFKIKINYKKITDISSEKEKIVVSFKKIKINLYPENKENFVGALNSKLTNKNS